jgi:hypothetical protein
MRTVGDAFVRSAKLCCLPSASRTVVLRALESWSGVGISFSSGRIEVLTGALECVGDSEGSGVDGTAGTARP